MTYTPRDYQLSTIESNMTFAKYRSGHGYSVLPGGAGKSVVIAKLAERLHDLGYSVVILARNEKLISQNHGKLLPEYWPDTGIYCAGLESRVLSRRITIGTIQSLAGVTLAHTPDFALVDECHEIHPDPESETQYWQFFNANNSPRILGFTATNFRTGSGLISWGEEIINIPIAPLINQGYILPPVNKIGAEVNLADIPVKMGEYAQERLAEVYDDPQLLELSVKQILKYSQGRSRNLIFCQSLRHCDIVANALEAAGESAQVVSGDTDKESLNELILPAHEAGEFKHMINCQLLTTGVDMPWIDMITLLMATKSKGKFEQAVYRGTRLYSGKQNFLLLDMGNNLAEHGALGSPYREKGKREAAQKKGRVCPQCETWIEKSNAKECSDCGYVFEVVEPHKVTHASRPDTERAPYYSGKLPIEAYQVTSVSYTEKKSSKGNPMIIAAYNCGYGKYGTIADFLMPHHPHEFLQSKFRNHCAKFGHPLPKDMKLTELSLTQWIYEMEANFKTPNAIRVDMNGEHPRIVEYEFEMEDLLDGDQILF